MTHTTPLKPLVWGAEEIDDPFGVVARAGTWNVIEEGNGFLLCKGHSEIAIFPTVEAAQHAGDALHGDDIRAERIRRHAPLLLAELQKAFAYINAEARAHRFDYTAHELAPQLADVLGLATGIRPSDSYTGE